MRLPPNARFPVDQSSEGWRLYGYRSDEHRTYLRERLASGHTREVADYIHTLRYDDFDYASMGRVYADLYTYLEDEYPDRDERNDLLRGIMSPSTE